MELLDGNSNEATSFRQIVKSVNFMTPRILGYLSIKDGIAEISTGDKFLDVEMYGVTVIINNKRSHNLSKCVHSMQEVEDYINELDMRYENISMQN